MDGGAVAGALPVPPAPELGLYEKCRVPGDWGCDPELAVPAALCTAGGSPESAPEEAASAAPASGCLCHKHPIFLASGLSCREHYLLANNIDDYLLVLNAK